MPYGFKIMAGVFGEREGSYIHCSDSKTYNVGILTVPKEWN